MNAHTKPQKNSVKTAPQSVTTGPIIGSRKIYVAAPEHLGMLGRRTDQAWQQWLA